MNLNNLFFELIRVAVGNQVCLSRTLSKVEWQDLYAMAKKQSLVGICFAGVQKLTINHPSLTVNLSESLRLQWMGMAAKIQQRNEVVNAASRKIYKLLKEDGLEACLLKGQGFASLYANNLSALRQSGDIDIWVMDDAVKILAWAKGHGEVSRSDYHHAEMQMDGMPEVELHYRPTLSRNLCRNRRLQSWFAEEGKNHVVYSETCGFAMPDNVFNIVLTLNHNLWHLMYEGVGLRQMMDLYFVLRTSYDNDDENENRRESIMKFLKNLKLERFASACMWVMKSIFGLEEEYMVCQPDEYEGKFLLEEIMRSGNFGKYDDRLKNKRGDTKWQLLWRWLGHNMRLMGHYTTEVLWTPAGMYYISMNKIK